MSRKLLISAVAGAAVLTLIASSENQVFADNLTLSASIDTGCTVGTGNLDFDTIDSTNGGSAVNTVTINLTNCLKDGATANAVAQVKIDSGANGVGAGGLRQLKHDTLTDKIEYTLTETSNGAVVPDGTIPANISGGTGAVVFDASIAASAVLGKSAGDYDDSVGITVSFL